MKQRNRDNRVLLLDPIRDIPEDLQTVPGFVDAWMEWQEYRREIRKPLKERSTRDQLRFLANQADPVAVIRQSIRNGWQGLFVLDRKSHRPKAIEEPWLEEDQAYRARTDRMSFTRLFQALEETYGKDRNEGRLRQYYRLFCEFEEPLLERTFTIAKKESTYFPAPKALFEILETLRSATKEGEIGDDPYAHVDCECGTSFSVKKAELPRGGRYRCPGSMAKGFNCNRSYEAGFIMNMLEGVTRVESAGPS